MELATINGIDIAYRVAGDPGGRPIVLIHGFTGNTRNWALTVKPLVIAGWRTLSADNPGHGHSAAPDDPSCYSMAAMADAHYELARELGFLPAIVVGHSMGGAIAEELTIRHPESVLATVLVDSAGGGPRDDSAATAFRDMDAAKALVAERGMAGLWDHQVESGLRLLPTTVTTEMRDMLRNEFALTSPTGYFNCARGMRDRRNTLPLLAHLAKPTLVIRGENENPGLVQAADGLAAAIPGVRYAVIPGAAHSPQFENDGEFNRILLEFLAAVPALADATAS